MEHVPGQLDFSIVEKEFPVTAFLRKISSICAFVETPGHVAVITRRGKRECALVSHVKLEVYPTFPDIPLFSYPNRDRKSTCQDL